MLKNQMNWKSHNGLFNLLLIGVVMTFTLKIIKFVEGQSNGLHCQKITVTACQGLGYNMTVMPNLAGDTNQLEAEMKIAHLVPLIESGCSKRARFLFCSSLFPLCTPDVPRPVTACKSLCETVKKECVDHLEIKKIWPEFLDCDTLPQPEKHELCMQIPEESIVKHQEQRPPTNFLHHQQQQHQQQQHQQQPNLLWPWLPWKMQHWTKTSSPISICPQNFTSSNLLENHCVPQCNRDVMYSFEQKKIAEVLILGLSSVCFVLTLFSLVTFWAEPTRFGYPERPVLFLCLCYNLYSICYLERIVFHNSSKAAAVATMANSEADSPACSLTPPCLASYITTSYLTLCAATWWLIFALCFYLSSHKKWSSEALEKKSGLFHVLAWVPPLAPPIAALLFEAVRRNELTAMCSAPGFVEVPALILLLLGIFFTERASRSLRSLGDQIQLTIGHHRFSQIRKRFLIFSLVYFFPTIIAIIFTFIEKTEIILPACKSADHCPSPEKVAIWPSLARITFQLAGGTLTGIWVWSRKTCESYRNRLVSTPNCSTSIKSVSSLPKKYNNASGKSTIGPLYSGISFHNVPVYNPHQSRV